MELLGLSLVIAAVVELGRRLKLKDNFAVATILGSALVGALAGAFHIYGATDVATGIQFALQACGLITVASKVG